MSHINKAVRLAQTPQGRIIKGFLIAQIIHAFYPLVPVFVPYKRVYKTLSQSGLITSKQLFNHMMHKYKGYPDDDTEK